MEAKRLYTLKDLKVGQVLTEITREGDYKLWEVLGRDPKLNPEGDLYEKYIYVLDSWGRVEVRRWYVSNLEIQEVYEGFPKEFILDRCIEKAKSHLQHLLDKKEEMKKVTK
jgi:hypothetical protein